MFEQMPLELNAMAEADDADVVAAIGEYARMEAAAGARRLAAIAELTSRRCDKEGKRAEWACDGWDSVAAEVACALGLRHNKASSQMSLSLALRHRLPKVAALYAEGKVSYRVVSAIAWHTDLVTDGPAVLIDAALAGQAAKFGRLSDYKLAQAIDFWVDRHDPAALRCTRSRARSRDFKVGDDSDNAEITSVWGKLYATDAEVLKRRLAQMANGVCDDDPRTMGQRRADAMGALAAGAERLACTCGIPDCPAAGDDGRAANVVIHVLTESAVLDGEPDPQMSGSVLEQSDDEEATRQKEPKANARPKPPPGLLLRGGIVPTPLLAELIRSGATVSMVSQPGDEPEQSYVPSAKLAEFVRCRDMTCRFPGCDVPAEFCDIDHTIPWPVGPTHASNLKLVCRKHHLLKTFWTGVDGWADLQLPDGTVIWTTPTGQTHKTFPASRIFFPDWDITTAELPPRQTPPPETAKSLMMPARKRTRLAERARRIREERKLNDAYVAERNKPPPF